MTTELNFSRWIVGTLQILKINPDRNLVEKNMDGIPHCVTIKAFLNKVFKNPDWQLVIVNAGNTLVKKKLLDEGKDNITTEKLNVTKDQMLYFWEGMCLDLLKTGETF